MHSLQKSIEKKIYIYKVLLNYDWLGFVQAFPNPSLFPQNLNMSIFSHVLGK